MKRLLSLAAVGALLLSTNALAGIIAYTSFEEPGTGAKYYDTGDPSVDHDLVNNDGQAPVDYVSVGGELGFDAWYYNTRDDVGLTDGDFVGVTDYTGTVGAFPDGAQGYQFSDPDGLMEVTFDTVALSGGPAGVSIDYFIIDDSYETSPLDWMRIWVVVDGGTELDIMYLSGDDLEGYGFWQTGSVDLTGYTTATLKVGVDTNGSFEGMYIDNIVFTPEPGSLLLLGLAGLFLRRR